MDYFAVEDKPNDQNHKRSEQAAQLNEQSVDTCNQPKKVHVHDHEYHKNDIDSNDNNNNSIPYGIVEPKQIVVLEIIQPLNDDKKSLYGKLKQNKMCICLSILLLIAASITFGLLSYYCVLDSEQCKPKPIITPTVPPTIPPSLRTVSPSLGTDKPTTSPTTSPTTVSPTIVPTISPTKPTMAPTLPTKAPTLPPTPIPQWTQLKVANGDQYGKNIGRMCIGVIPNEPYQVHIVECLNQLNQKFWHYNGMIRMQLKSDYCLTSSPTSTYFSKCTGESNQLWDYVSGTFRPKNDYSSCLDFDWTDEILSLDKCNGGWNQNFKWDDKIASSPEYFSLKLSGSRDNVCLEVEKGNGNNTFFRTCNGSDQQLFTSFAGQIKSKSQNNNNVMTFIDGKNTLFYQQYEPFNKKQKWYFSGDQLVNTYYEDQCVTFNWDMFDAYISKCASAWNQLLRMDYTNTVPIQYRRLRIQGSNLCAEIDTGSSNRLHAVQCRPNQNQLFELTIGGALQSNSNPSKCIEYNDMNGYVYANNYNNGNNQAWKFINGKISTIFGDRCFDYDPNDSYGKISTLACNDNWNQKFEWAVLYEVTCQFTVDNILHEMWVNGIDITSQVSGDFDWWPTVKTVRFVVPSATPQTLAIKGSDSDTTATSIKSGIMLKCTSGELSKWNFSTKLDSTWKGYSSNSYNFPQQWYLGITNEGSTPLEKSTSPFNLPGVSIDSDDKFWVTGSNKYAGFVKFIN